MRKIQLDDPGITREAICAAHESIKTHTHNTPVLTSSYINAIAGCELYFKCENFQKVGAFKARGALHAALQLSDDKKRHGIATHSSGNHGQAVAWAAKMLGIPAHIVMPENAPNVKIAAVKDYGGLVTLCESTLAGREAALAKVVSKTGAHFIHPYNDVAVITGQATCAKELLATHPDLNAIVTPVGGGGLLSGTALSASFFGRGVRVYGAEPEGASDAWQSFRAGRLIPLKQSNTIADGLRTSLGHHGFAIIMQRVTDILMVSDSEIISAMRLIWERLKIIIEPSCAVPLAAILRHPKFFEGQKVGIILTGGNVVLDVFFETLGRV